MSYVFFPFLTAVAANAFLHFGFGLRLLASPGRKDLAGTWAPALAVLLMGIAVWPLFAFVLAPLGLAHIELVALAPLSVVVSALSDRAVASLPGSRPDGARRPDPLAASAYDGLVFAAGYLTLRLSADYPQAALFSLGSAVGYLACEAALRAIRERSDTEPVPRCLRGAPLTLVSAGLLSMLASFLAVAFFEALGKSL